VLNAANEVAVAGYLAGRMGFLDIVGTVDHIVTDLAHIKAESLDDIIVADNEARRRTSMLVDEKFS
jgi:1-deoxy-D-xylulose-5-phosphate reductoisomerase